MRLVPRAGKAALLAFVLGAMLLAAGSIVSIRGSWPGQVVLSVFAGAWFVALGAMRLSWLLAIHPHQADELFGGGEASTASPSFRDFPGVRWTLAASLLVIALGAALIIASDFHAWSSLRWAKPAGRGWLILG